jgi:plastocyanin
VIGWLVLPLALLAGGSPSPKTHTVQIRRMAFHPAELTVAPGDTVVWINRDIVPHTATAAGRSPWDTGQLSQGQSRRIIARREGKTSYVCVLHPTMQGSLIIERNQP